MKTKKALSKRIRITGRNKIMKRPPRQNHFNAKATGDERRAKHKEQLAPASLLKDAKQLIQF